MKTTNNQQQETKDGVQQKDVLNIFGLSQNPLKTAWSYPIGKVVIISTGAVALLFATGGFFRLLAWTRKGYNDYNSTRRKK